MISKPILAKMIFLNFFCLISIFFFSNMRAQTDVYAEEIYPFFMKRRSLHKKGIDYLSINLFNNYSLFLLGTPNRLFSIPAKRWL